MPDYPDYNEFYDPSLVAVYDAVCPIGEYEAFYVDLAAELSASSIIDLGCGSGQLTCALAGRGYQMTGVDPSSAMLDLARRRPGGEDVTWIEGDARSLGEARADLAIMTGHVAQFFLDDQSWQAALAAIYTALKPGGHIAFESRNPVVQPWHADGATWHIDWPSETSRRVVYDPVAGRVDFWTKVREVREARVRYELRYVFERSGEELISTNELRFRTLPELTQSLTDAGFSVESVFGDWDRRPADPGSPEFIFVAARG